MSDTFEPEPTVPPPGAPDAPDVPDDAPDVPPDAPGVTDAPPEAPPAALSSTVPEPTERPPGSDGERMLDPRMVLLWRIGLLPSFVLPVTVLGGLLARLLPVPGWILALPLAILLGLAIGPLQTLRWRRWSWRMTDSSVELRFGVLTRRHVILPHFRVQQIDVFEGPLERLLGLATLTVTTASAAGSASLPGLTAASAPVIRAELLALAARANLELGRSGRDAV